ncbi:hypothetical protein D3C85_1084010 [compost metagenome]
MGKPAALIFLPALTNSDRRFCYKARWRFPYYRLLLILPIPLMVRHRDWPADI